MRLSLVVGLYNMRREIPRSLLTMAASYQRIPSTDYEIILVDNGSALPPDEAALHALADNMRYVFVDDASPSPTSALNAAVDQARGELVTVVIDGARMFSPGLLTRVFEAFRAFDDPFVYAPSLHLGPQLQNDSAYGGYDQAVEDSLLETVDWQSDGYRLFDVSNIAAVPERLAKPTFESNCFTVRRSTWERVGGYHPGFATSTGGGLANWELFARYMNDAAITPVLLVGEATFHQFHGGASTNQPRREHPVRGWLDEHREIFGKPYAWPVYEPVLFGQASAPVAWHLYERNIVSQIALLRSLSAAGDHDPAIAIARLLCDQFPNDPGKLQILAEALDRSGRRAEALAEIDRALEIAPTQAELQVTRGIVYVGLGRYDDARRSYDRAVELDDLYAEAYFHRGHLSLRERHYSAAIDDFEQAMVVVPDPPPHYGNDLAHARGLATEGRSEDEWAGAGPSPDIEATVAAFVSSVRHHYQGRHSVELIDEHALHGSFSPAQLDVLQQLVAAAQPSRVLVIGGYLGLSTRAIVAATEAVGSTVVTVDPNIRHRIFDAPLTHARAFVSDGRVQFIDGFFGARTDGGTRFDLREFKPQRSEADIDIAVAAAPTAAPQGPFDFVLVDADVSTDLHLAAAAVPILSAHATLVLRQGNDAVSIAQLLSGPGSGRAVDHLPVDGELGFVCVRIGPH